MIIQEINATVNSYTLNGKIIVPSTIMTATPQAENGDLAYAPNFQLKLGDNDKKLNVTDIVNTSFTFGDYNYTSNMRVTNRSGDIATLQFVDGLTSELNDDSSDDDSSDDPDIPETHTFSFAQNLYTCKATYDGTSTTYDDALVTFLYDGNEISLSPSECGLNKFGSIAQYTNVDGGYGFRCIYTSMSISTSITATATYNGLTATTSVRCIYEKNETNPQLTQSVNNILGSDYDVVNDMTEEDATNKANEILYGNES